MILPFPVSSAIKKTMMHRVSSRPRLVSDVDKAFVNATVELSDGAWDGSGYADYSSFDDDGLYLDDDSHYQAVHNSSHVSPLMAAAPKTSPLSSNDCEGNSGNPDKEVVVTSQSYASSGDLSGYLTCLEDNTGPTGLLMPRPPSLLELSFCDNNSATTDTATTTISGNEH